MLARGLISHANAGAARLGVVPGMRCHEAAVRLMSALQPPAYAGAGEQGRHVLAPGVVGLDSVGMVEKGDAGRILVIGSHASLHGGRPESALAVDAALAIFHEAGGECSRRSTRSPRRESSKIQRFSER